MTNQQSNKACFEPRYRPIINSYVFMLIPFIILLFVKLKDVGVPQALFDMWLIADWSLISFVILSQSLSAYLTISGESKFQAKDPHYLASVFIKYIVFGIIPSTMCIWEINTNNDPSIWIYGLQAFVFCYSSYRYFIDSLNLQKIQFVISNT
ncbi:hypothetical protein EDB73_108121 [Vibrio crassostreae]|nr:hypothetical protein EDB73_108121 [Vibrio crassostreae]